jgi:hypothetical protein
VPARSSPCFAAPGEGGYPRKRAGVRARRRRGRGRRAHSHNSSPIPCGRGSALIPVIIPVLVQILSLLFQTAPMAL